MQERISNISKISVQHSARPTASFCSRVYEKGFLGTWGITRVGTLIVATIYLQLIQIDTCFEVLLSFTVVTSIVYNPLPAMWKS